MKQDDQPTSKPDMPAQSQGPPTEVPASRPKPLDDENPGNVPIPPKAPPQPPGGGG